jgi:hypothetical protein
MGKISAKNKNTISGHILKTGLPPIGGEAGLRLFNTGHRQPVAFIEPFVQHFLIFVVDSDCYGIQSDQ